MENKKQEGFTLVEVLISLLLFSVGMLSVATQFAGSMKTRINTEVHSSVMQITAQVIEPLNNALTVNNASFKTGLNKIGTKELPITPVFNTNNSEKEIFSIAISLAEDHNGLNLLTTDTATWVPPFNVVLVVNYINSNNISLPFPSTHVFIP